jgi:hypothetical protein
VRESEPHVKALCDHTLMSSIISAVKCVIQHDALFRDHNVELPLKNLPQVGCQSNEELYLLVLVLT